MLQTVKFGASCRNFVVSLGNILAAFSILVTSANADLATMNMDTSKGSYPGYIYAGNALKEVDGLQLHPDITSVHMKLLLGGWGVIELRVGDSVECMGAFYSGSASSSDASKSSLSSIKGTYYPRPNDDNCPGKGEVRIVSTDKNESYKSNSPPVSSVTYQQYDDATGRATVWADLELLEVVPEVKFNVDRPCDYAMWAGVAVFLPELLKCDASRVMTLLSAGWTVPMRADGAELLFKDGVVKLTVKDTYSWVYPNEPSTVTCEFEDQTASDVPNNLEWVSATLKEITEKAIILSCEPASEP